MGPPSSEALPISHDSDTSKLVHADLTSRVITAFYAVYDELGYGFLESVYRNALAYEFQRRNIACAREVPVDVWYRGEKIGHFRADLIVEQTLVVEVKASKTIDESDRKQLLNYLRATNLELGLLLHFGPKPAFQRLIFENQRKRGLTAVVRE